MLHRLAIMAAVGLTVIAAKAVREDLVAVSKPDCDYVRPGFHAKECSGVYYKCVNKRLYSYECPLGFYFNPTKNLCDYKLNVPSCAHDSYDYMDSTPSSDYPSGSVDYMDPAPRSVVSSGSDDYMEPTPRSADASRSDDYMDTTPGSDDYMDPTPGSADSSVAPTVTSETPSTAIPIDCNKMGNGYHSKGCSSDVLYCTNGILETHQCLTGTFFNKGDNMCYGKEFVPACGGEPDYPSGADYPGDSTTESPSTPSTTTLPTTPSPPTKPSITTVSAGTVAPRVVPVIVHRAIPTDYHRHSYKTFFGITLILFSILCILYLLCGNSNFACSASMNVGSSTNCPDNLPNAECKKSGMYNIV